MLNTVRLKKWQTLQQFSCNLLFRFCYLSREIATPANGLETEFEENYLQQV